MMRTGVDAGTIKFTNSGDVSLVAQIYERAFLEEMSAATALYYPGLDWGDEHVTTLAAALSFAHAKGSMAKLETLYLTDNKIGDLGMSSLSEALAKGSLAPGAEVYLFNNNAKKAGKQAVRDVTKDCGRNVHI